MKSCLIVACVATTLILSGCNRSSDNQPSTSPSAGSSSPNTASLPSTASSTRGDTMVRGNGADISIAPGSVSGCSPVVPVIAKVSWEVTDHSIDHVKIMVVDPGSSEGRLFSEGGFSGEVNTGPWVKPGTRFDLLNASSQAKLASYTVAEKPCHTAP